VGAVSDKDKDALVDAVNAECQRLVDAAVHTVVSMEAPLDGGTGAPTRIVDVAGCRCPCGGTHVKNTAEIGKITVTRVKKVKKCVKFSYTIE
jgi:misacylated tRNA(Ala) deacylase